MASEEFTEKQREFFPALEALTRKYGVFIGGCGCCGSPWVGGGHVDDSDFNDVDYQGVHYRGGYAYGESQRLEWKSAYDLCLEAHRKEWEAMQNHLWKDQGIGKYGEMNTAEFGRLLLAGNVPEAA